MFVQTGPCQKARRSQMQKGCIESKWRRPLVVCSRMCYTQLFLWQMLSGIAYCHSKR